MNTTASAVGKDVDELARRPHGRSSQGERAPCTPSSPGTGYQDHQLPGETPSDVYCVVSTLSASTSRTNSLRMMGMMSARCDQSPDLVTRLCSRQFRHNFYYAAARMTPPNANKNERGNAHVRSSQKCNHLCNVLPRRAPSSAL